MVEKAKDTDFWRGEHCNFYPRRGDSIVTIEDIEKFILPGWVPEKPFITKSDHVMAFGSCFADEIQNYLRDHGYNIPPIEKCNITKFGAGMVNTFTMLQQLQWAYDLGSSHRDDEWYFDAAYPPAYRMNEDKQITRELFDSTDVFILTLGLSEVWCDKETGYVFWKAVPGNIFDPKKHEFRVSSVDENWWNLISIIKILRDKRPNASIIFTLSPVPLLATFRPVSCITANSVSKAILRAALDEVLRDVDDDNIFYWPAYEIVTTASHYSYTDDHRHPTRETVAKIMALFDKYFLKE